MSEIRLLDQETIDKIAAGEVVERPVSVVKELVENSIDAGANAVTVEIRDGGISLIRVTDNGEGIEKNQVREAFARHATSKIRDVSDLDGVRSLGFRGEALSSISAVGQVELITRRESEITGVRFTVNGGVPGTLEEIGAPRGSTFIVRNLFYNTPARKKFLKSAVTEAGYISDMMEHLALSRPEISFRFINNGQVRLHSSGNGSLRDVIYAIYGREITAGLLEVGASKGRMPDDGEGTTRHDPETQEKRIEEKPGAVTVRGFIGKPEISRGNRNYETYFVAGRFVKNKVVMKAIEDAYGNHLMQHRYPFTVLFIEVPEGYVDVNVHPAKQEVRFADNAAVYEKIKEAVSRALEEKELIPAVSASGHRELARERKQEMRERMERSAQAPEPFEEVRRDLFRRGDSPYTPKYEYRKPGQSQGLAEGRIDSQTEGPMESQVDSQTKGLMESQVDSRTEGPMESQVEDRLAVPGRDITSGFRSGDRSGFGLRTASEDAPKDQPWILREDGNQLRQASLFDDRLLSPQSVPEHRLIGQVFGTYWIVEFHDNLYIIDQHAAHEKVIYERMVKAMQEKRMTSQQLLVPLIVTMSLQEEELFRKYRELFEETGFEVEHFGGREYSIRAVPDNLYGFTDEQLFTQMLDSLSEATGSPDMSFVYEKLAGMACKAAIKGNHTYSPQEANSLIRELLSLENPYNCPHGRPTIISMSKHELERKFKRIVG